VAAGKEWSEAGVADLESRPRITGEIAARRIYRTRPGL